MGSEPPILSYDDVREYAEEFLGEFHSGGAVPTPIEEIVEFGVSDQTMAIRLERDGLLPPLSRD